jgi:hypothetical protein
MANFRYRLQTLLDRKIDRRKELERSLVERQKELAAEQKALAEMEEAQVALEATLVEARRKLLAIQAGESGYTLQLRIQHLRGLRADVETGQGAVLAQRLRVGDFEDRVAEAQRLLADASREVEVLEKHRERLETRFLRALQQKEALEQDEMGGIIFNQRRRAHESSQ